MPIISHIFRALLPIQSHLSSGVPLQQETKQMVVQQKKGVAQAEDTPAYSVLQQYGLLDASYRKDHFDDIFDSPHDITANSSRADNMKKRFRWGVYWTPGCGWLLYVSPAHTQWQLGNDESSTNLTSI